MRIEDAFEVPLPIGEAWLFLLDIEQIASCMPGAQLEEVSGDMYQGRVRVKVGPIQAQYQGQATLETVDEAARRVVLQASGRDVRGQGTAKASVCGQLTEIRPDVTRVGITADIDISGRVAQFGRGVMQDVSRSLISEFSQNLQRLIADSYDRNADLSGADDGNAAAQLPADPQAPGPPSSALNLGSIIGPAVAKRAGPYILAGVILVLLMVWIVRR